MTENTADPLLLTPGPLTTSAEVKQAALRDWGSRDSRFIALNAEIRDRVVALLRGTGTHVCVPVQGSGTFAVEGMIGTCLPANGKLLVLINGAYGHRIAKICQISGRAYSTLETPEDTPPDPSMVAERLAADPAITHVAAVHCETTSGILNPIERIAEVTAEAGRALLIDAMSSFGAIDIDARSLRFDALAASSNKCLQGLPGLGLVVFRQEALEACENNAPSLSLDLYDQWTAMEGNGQWRFTPPTHVVAAFRAALEEHEKEGSVSARGARYRRNWQLLVDGMRALGFETLLPDELQAPIIVTFLMPADENFDFVTFYDMLQARGYVIYPGKLTVADSFRIGCIGALGEPEMSAFLEAVRAVMGDLGVRGGAPLKPKAAVG